MALLTESEEHLLDLHRTRFRLSEILFYALQTVPLQVLVAITKQRSISATEELESRLVSHWRKTLQDAAGTIGVSERRLDQLMRWHVRAHVSDGSAEMNSLSNQGRATKIPRPRRTTGLERRVRERIKQVEAAIASVPNSPRKAHIGLLALAECYDSSTDSDQCLDAMVFLRDELPSNLVSGIVVEWRAASARHAKLVAKDRLAGRLFWISRDLHDVVDNVSRYLFRATFNIGEFAEAFSDVEANLAETLVEGMGGIDSMMAALNGDDRVRLIGYNLLLISRCRQLVTRLRLFVDVALLRVASRRDLSGAWTDYVLHDVNRERHSGRYLPDPFTTAVCALALLRVGASDDAKEAGMQGARWLLDNQLPAGGWPFGSDTGAEPRSADLMTTLFAVEALLRSGLTNIQYAVESGTNWILSQQDSLGWWDPEGGPPFPLVTVMVLELLALIDTSRIQLTNYLTTSRHLLDRAVRLSIAGAAGDRQLAIIAAYHAIESFAYGILSQPTINVRVFERDGSTIGARKALAALQQYLQENGKLGRSQVLAHRNALDRLAHIRDEVVHKGLDISDRECQELVGAAQEFVSKYSRDVLGGDILL